MKTSFMQWDDGKFQEPITLKNATEKMHTKEVGKGVWSEVKPMWLELIIKDPEIKEPTGLFMVDDYGYKRWYLRGRAVSFDEFLTDDEILTGLGISHEEQVLLMLKYG